MRAALFFVLLVLAAVFAQDRVPRITIDDFSVGAGDNKVSVELDRSIANGDTPAVETDSFSLAGCTGLLGCARDMSMTVTLGQVGRVSTSNIFPVSDSEFFTGEWAVSNPKNSQSVTILQYDGPDNSFDLDINGLNGVDLTDGGLGTGLRVTVISDLDTSYQFDLYSPDGGVCEVTIDTNEITGSYELEDIFVFIDFDDFDGDCDLTNIGAIEVTLPSFDALDAIMRSFRVVGNPAPASPPPSPSPSRTPTPGPSRSVEECMCHCPIFTCALIFDPDDDENNAYYFDDDDENAGLRPPVPVQDVEDDGGILIPVVDDDEDSGSGAASIVASTAAVLLALAVAF